MRKIVSWNDNWTFTKEQESCEVTIPHTWNAADGTDGGNDYWRGTASYTKKFARPEMTAEDEVWIEFAGVAMSAQVLLNGVSLAEHKGGYSTFRVNLTSQLQDENTLEVLVDNSKNDQVYPQKADFTFYGGIYREVKLITVSKAHFELGYYGSSAVKVTPVMEGEDAAVTVETWQTAGEKIQVVCDGNTYEAANENGTAKVSFTISNAHLWDGLQDPFMYDMTVSLVADGAVTDEMTTSFGCRSFKIDPEKGFFLNGRSYPLCGAARHQDREGLGNALTAKEHEEDLAIMLEMGCNCIRLAHYQHDSYFYDLCDRAGMITWVEIPYISEHMPTANDNTISQMKELVVQNYNHPSIVCWGLSNEITSSGGVNDNMINNHKALNDLCHELDQTRPTTMAHAFMLETDSPMVTIADVCGYNLYYGWYLGELADNDTFMDNFHKQHPDYPLGLTEYGADANPQYQNPRPDKGDWTESYQAVYHEHLLKMWSERPYIWIMSCWNMFDFGADGRNEGGKPGQNQKGLVTFDRKLKKDAFYIYKAYLSQDPFVHLCGSRYVDRPEEETEIKVYTNQPQVTLLVNGQEIETKACEKVACFTIANVGKQTIEAVAGDLKDSMTIQKVEQANPDYNAGGGEVVNWFDKDEEVTREGYYSIKDSMGDIKKNPAGAAMLARIMAKATESYGDVAKNVEMPKAMQEMMDRAPLESMLKQAGKAVSPQMVKELNHALNQIPKN